MRWIKQKKVRIREGAVDLAADINAAVSVNTSSGSQTTHTSSHSDAAVFQGPRPRQASGRDAGSPPRPTEPEEQA